MKTDDRIELIAVIGLLILALSIVVLGAFLG